MTNPNHNEYKWSFTWLIKWTTGISQYHLSWGQVETEPMYMRKGFINVDVQLANTLYKNGHEWLKILKLFYMYIHKHTYTQGINLLVKIWRYGFWSHNS